MNPSAPTRTETAPQPQPALSEESFGLPKHSPAIPAAPFGVQKTSPDVSAALFCMQKTSPHVSAAPFCTKKPRLAKGGIEKVWEDENRASVLECGGRDARGTWHRRRRSREAIRPQRPPKLRRSRNTAHAPVTGVYPHTSIPTSGESGVAEARALLLPLCHRTPGRCRVSESHSSQCPSQVGCRRVDVCASA